MTDDEPTKMPIVSALYALATTPAMPTIPHTYTRVVLVRAASHLLKTMVREGGMPPPEIRDELEAWAFGAVRKVLVQLRPSNDWSGEIFVN